MCLKLYYLVYSFVACHYILSGWRNIFQTMCVSEYIIFMFLNILTPFTKLQIIVIDDVESETKMDITCKCPGGI